MIHGRNVRLLSRRSKKPAGGKVDLQPVEINGQVSHSLFSANMFLVRAMICESPSPCFQVLDNDFFRDTQVRDNQQS